MPEDTTRPSDLDRMNREELLDLRKQIDRAIETVEKRHRDEAIAKARAAAEEHGFKLEELVAPGLLPSIVILRTPRRPGPAAAGSRTG